MRVLDGKYSAVEVAGYTFMGMGHGESVTYE